MISTIYNNKSFTVLDSIFEYKTSHLSQQFGIYVSTKYFYFDWVNYKDIYWALANSLLQKKNSVFAISDCNTQFYLVWSLIKGSFRTAKGKNVVLRYCYVRPFLFQIFCFPELYLQARLVLYYMVLGSFPSNINLFFCQIKKILYYST